MELGAALHHDGLRMSLIPRSSYCLVTVSKPVLIYGVIFRALLFEELPSPSKSNNFEPLRVNRNFSRSFPGSGLMMGSEEGLVSEIGESD